MNSPFSIRKLGPSDLDEYIRLRREGVHLDPIGFGRAYTTENKIPRSVYAEFLALSPNQDIWGAFYEEALVGMVRLQADGDKTRRTIYCLYVCPAMRSRGIGRRLLLRAVHEATHHPSVTEIYLKGITKSYSALAFYHSVGFHEYDVQNNMFSVGGDFYSEYRMCKRLLRPPSIHRGGTIKTASPFHKAAPSGGPDVEGLSEAAQWYDVDDLPTTRTRRPPGD